MRYAVIMSRALNLTDKFFSQAEVMPLISLKIFWPASCFRAGKQEVFDPLKVVHQRQQVRSDGLFESGI